MGSTPKAAQSPAASPAKGKAAAPPKKPSGKGVTKRTGKKPAAKKGAPKGKGRGPKKIYGDPRVQASYERQKDLRELYSQVALAIKPALDELADQTLKQLTEDYDAHKEADEYATVQGQLDAQLERVLENAEREHDMRVNILTHDYELERLRAETSFMNSFNYQTEEFYDGALNRTSIVSELRREGHSLDTPDLTYSYVNNIPYVSCRAQSEQPEAPTLEQTRKAKPSTKRKAEDQLDEQVDSKKPRHTGGLLASEMQPDGVPDANEPSPTPLEEQEPAPVSGKDIPDIPSGAFEPDEYGVRAVIRRVKSPANRFIIPPLFSWDDEEIGFRDSTNDSTRIAKRSTRGRYLDTPNSNTWHLDHTVKEYDCREYKDDALDSEIVKKHRLHPKLGFFLPTSTNESEPPDERVDGTRPVVVVPDSTTTVHASRSVRSMKMDLMLKEDRVKSTVGEMLKHICETDRIDPEEIVNDEMRDRERQAVERLAAPSDESEAAVEKQDPTQLMAADNSLFMSHASLLLSAAEHSENDRPRLPSPNPRPSRPYDAVRDVFTSAEPAPVRPEVQFPEPDTTALNTLADAIERVTQEEQRTAIMSDSSMIDPRLLGLSSHQPPPPPPNAFLQTALNPTPTYTHIAPAPVAPMEMMQPVAPPRNPFASQNNATDSPILPPLRPNRSDGIGKGPNMPQPQPLPPPAQRPQDFCSPHGPVRTNSGSFFPPAPSRPYHQGLSFQEQGLMPLSMSMQQGPPMSGPGMMPNQPPLPPHISPYPLVMSPPLLGQPQLAPMPAQMEPPAPSVSPPGPAMMTPSSPVHASRQRNSVSSNGNGSGKYRKIAAAPIPHNRPWPSNGGTELRLAHYDHKEAIKDYRANEPPPRSGPTTIRGWNVNNVSKGRNRGVKKEDSEEKESPK